MKLILLIVVCLGPSWFAWSQTPPAPGKTQAYLRYFCAANGNVAPKAFGEYPLFDPPLRVAFEASGKGRQVLFSNLLPLSLGSYQPLPPSAGKLVVQATDVEGDPKTPSPSRASMNFQPKANHYYTLLIQEEGSELKLELVEDPAGTPLVPKEDEAPPPPQRSLRCIVLEPEVRVKISCEQAGFRLEASRGNPSKADNLKKGTWNVSVEVDRKGTPLRNTVELDLESPGNWTLFFMRDIYGRIVPYLQKDGVTE